ncbi:hypothetical protein SAMN02745121_01376 [Nannocystis exedens]|uniref:Uncharacterized protein n=1 Tax=Nannocystis exedens TaxID=54 RepID=A0A1I1UXV1_9BACT|nr:hypothetical protein [Nannocystis exedens]PCC72167.1 hypothetical protein NAEX_05246 [Nannocystis exedens]SFD75385.1 hypothetical protein SAMN02745121_01376 [Nannocystis exedens]
MFKNTCSFALVIAAAGLLAGCKKYAIEPPVGFVEVSSHSYETRMKAQDNVGLRVHRFANVRGGTLGYWAADLVNKLGKRGYVLTGQQPARSKNGREGTRFDFDYTIPGSDEPKFYTVVLFVTDEYKFTLELAGDREHAGAYRARVAEITGELKVRGCKVASKICGGPQPPKLSSPPPDPIPGLPEPPEPATPSAPTPTPAAAASSSP